MSFLDSLSTVIDTVTKQLCASEANVDELVVVDMCAGIRAA